MVVLKWYERRRIFLNSYRSWTYAVVRGFQFTLMWAVTWQVVKLRATRCSQPLIKWCSAIGTWEENKRTIIISVQFWQNNRDCDYTLTEFQSRKSLTAVIITIISGSTIHSTESWPLQWFNHINKSIFQEQATHSSVITDDYYNIMAYCNIFRLPWLCHAVLFSGKMGTATQHFVTQVLGEINTFKTHSSLETCCTTILFVVIEK